MDMVWHCFKTTKNEVEPTKIYKIGQESNELQVMEPSRWKPDELYFGLALLYITLRFTHRNGCKCIVTMYSCVYIYMYIYIYIYYTDICIYIYIYYTYTYIYGYGYIYIYVCMYVYRYRYSPVKSSWLITFCHSIVMAIDALVFSWKLSSFQKPP